MARPKKDGLDYFPMDTEFDEKIEALEELHGNDGFSWIIRFWQKAYRTGGEVDLSGIFGVISAKNSRITVEKQAQIVDDCINLGLIYKTESGSYFSEGVKSRLSQVNNVRQKSIDRWRKRKEKESKVNKRLLNTSPKNSRSISSDNEFPQIPLQLEQLQGFKELWEDWKKHRIQLKKPLTPGMVKEQFTFLISQPNPIDCIKTSIRNGWQGLFEFKQGAFYQAPLPGAVNQDRNLGE